jgi:hypothetical protein
MNTNVTADIEGNTLTLKNGKGETQSFEIKGKTTRDVDIDSETGKTTFTYKFDEELTVAITSPGHEGTVHSITVFQDGNSVYEGTLSEEEGDALIIALKKKGEVGGKRKKTIRRKRVSKKKRTTRKKF